MVTTDKLKRGDKVRTTVDVATQVNARDVESLGQMWARYLQTKERELEMSGRWKHPEDKRQLNTKKQTMTRKGAQTEECAATEVLREWKDVILGGAKRSVEENERAIRLTPECGTLGTRYETPLQWRKEKETVVQCNTQKKWRRVRDDVRVRKKGVDCYWCKGEWQQVKTI